MRKNLSPDNQFTGKLREYEPVLPGSTSWPYIGRDKRGDRRMEPRVVRAIGHRIVPPRYEIRLRRGETFLRFGEP